MTLNTSKSNLFIFSDIPSSLPVFYPFVETYPLPAIIFENRFFLFPPLPLLLFLLLLSLFFFLRLSSPLPLSLFLARVAGRETKGIQLEREEVEKLREGKGGKEGEIPTLLLVSVFPSSSMAVPR